MGHIAMYPELFCYKLHTSRGAFVSNQSQQGCAVCCYVQSKALAGVASRYRSLCGGSRILNTWDM